MNSLTINPHRSLLVRLALIGAALPFLGIQSALAQDELHPDWSQVWNQGEPQNEQGTMTIPANVVIPVTLDNALSSATARKGDIVTATPISRVDGDSEFPPGTRIGGVVSQVQPADKSIPGVLDIDFQSALLPDGTEVPLYGFIASLESDAVHTENGHLIARDGGRVNAWKAIGIGGAAGFVLGRLLDTEGAVPTILGAAGGYLYSRSNSRRGDEASISGGTVLGVRLENPVTFPDPDGYARARLSYLETNHEFSPQGYGWNESIAAPPTYRYDDYYVVTSRPAWVTFSTYDYFGFPLIPVFVPYRPYYYRDPRWSARNSFWNRPDFHRGPRNTSWNWRPSYGNGSKPNWNNRPSSGNGSIPGWNNRPSSGNNSWNRPIGDRPSTPNNNYNWGWNTSRGDSRGNSNNSQGAGNRSWVGRPGGSTSSGSITKPNLSPISPSANKPSNSNWGGSNNRPSRDSFSSSGSWGRGGVGSSRGGGGSRGGSSGGRSGRR